MNPYLQTIKIYILDTEAIPKAGNGDQALQVA